MMAKKLPLSGVYPVITEKFCRNGSALLTLRQVLKGGARMVQLREKEMHKPRLLALAEKFRHLTKKAGALLIINDHVDVALACGADGVHLGQDDLPCREAKKIEPRLIVGVSTHNIKEAVAAVKAGADYINIGPVFTTKTKRNKMKPLGPETVRNIAARIRIPFTVMGGIKRENLVLVLGAGGRIAAMATGITMAENPVREIMELNAVITGFFSSVWKQTRREAARP